MNARQTAQNTPEITAQQTDQQTAEFLSDTIKTLSINHHSTSRRQPPIFPTRSHLTALGKSIKTIIDDTTDAISDAARNLESHGMVAIAPEQITTLAKAGINEEDLQVIASLNGMTFSYRVRELHDRMKTICSVPLPDQDGTVDWTTWTFHNRESNLYVRPANMTGDLLGTILDRVCEKIADRVWENLPDTTYVAKRLAQQSSPVMATNFVIVLIQCHNMAVRIDNRIRTATIQIPGTEKRPDPPGLLDTEARPYPHPTTPSEIRDVLKALLGKENAFKMDIGELKDIDALRRDTPDLTAVYLNQNGDVWYSKENQSYLMHSYLSSDTPENRSDWPNAKQGIEPDLEFTAGELNLANAVAPNPPFPTSSMSHRIQTANPIIVTAWLNKITAQQAIAKINNEPDPGAPEKKCPSASECPTACAYVQRVGLLHHTLFPDGKYEHCHFHHFRVMHGNKPSEARHQLAINIANKTMRESRNHWEKNDYTADQTAAENKSTAQASQKAIVKQTSKKPLQTSLF